jgi:hypothetical protein
MQEQMPVNYRKLSKKNMIHPMKQKVLLLQMLLLKYWRVVVYKL